jgi:hypothetical protein
MMAATFQPMADSPTVFSRPTATGSPRWGFLEWFVIAQTALPALLYLPGTQAFRVPIRIAPFAVSLAGMVWWSTTRPTFVLSHPARPFLIAALAYLNVMIFHPHTNTVLAGTAQVMLYLCVIAPIFWVPGLVKSQQQIVRLLAVLLACNGVNAAVGILQVYDPDRWLPQEFSTLVVNSVHGLGAVIFEGPEGRQIIRPPGLFDNPGAVCGPGMVAGFLGLAFAASPIPVWKRALALLLAIIGLVAIYLSQVRTSFLILVGMLLVYVTVLAMQNQKLKLVTLLGIGIVLGIVALFVASLLAGDAVVDRFSTLFEGDPLAVYYAASRGPMLEHAFTNLLTEYPLGAGLARWGMMRTYFGNPWNFESPEIWSELQISAWILDGGIVLLILYGLALLVTGASELSLIRSSSSPDFKFWAASVFAVNIGVFALIFGFTPFTTQTGMQYWFLAGMLYGAKLTTARVSQ